MKPHGRKRHIPRLRLYPDPILAKKCTRVPVPTQETFPVVHGVVTRILRDMRYLLLASKNGVGISAPQAGYSVRVILIKTKVMINPRITRRSLHKTKFKEGCLSYPGAFNTIKRSEGITVKYIDEWWVERTEKLVGLNARIVQHEVDHLNGKCRVATAEYRRVMR